MIFLPLVFVLVVVGVMYVARHHHEHVLTTGSVHVSTHRAAAISPLGRWSLIVLAAALGLWLLTFTTLPSLLHRIDRCGGVHAGHRGRGPVPRSVAADPDPAALRATGGCVFTAAFVLLQ